jgi:hypothetical protein
MTHIFVHYHLRPGGVTRVIQHEASVFHHTGLDFLTISGGPCGTVAGTHRHLPALDYADGANLRWADLKDLARDLPKPWIWHIHNPSLGCHPDMASVIQSMAQSGERMILHLHDFAEDDRPQNLQRLSTGPPWFPSGDRIHYVVLTPRDRNILTSAGLQENQVTVITNPVTASPQPPPCCPSARVIYPTRAITRKNIGEMLLLAALSPAGTRFSTTLGPGKSMHQSNYRHWQETARKFDLPVDWAIAENRDHAERFDDIISKATHLLSTSVQEGFGMAFVEAIAWQRPLIGRAIPHISEHLSRHGIRHPLLYDGILIDTLEFSEQSSSAQTELLKIACEEPSRVRIIQGGESHDAANWLAQALSRDQRSLPLSLLDSFHPDLHAGMLRRIAETLSKAPASTVSQLHAESIRTAFFPHKKM